MKVRLWATSRDMTDRQRKQFAVRIRKNASLPKDEPIEFEDVRDDYVPTAAEMKKSKRGGVDGG